MIQGIHSYLADTASNRGQAVAAERTGQSRSLQKEENSVSYQGDRVTLSSQSVSLLTYSRNLKLQGEEDIFAALKQMLLQTFKDQGVALQIPEAGIDLETITQEEAVDLVADDGYFGVDKTSQRIVDFAISLAGNDPARADAIREGIENGFNEALEAFGGSLPEISYQTYDAAMQKLDDWVAESTQVAS